MDKRQEERLALEGNSVFQDLRMQRDALLEALEGGLTAVGLLYGRPFDPIASKATEDFLIAAGAVIRAAKGETT